jgi:plastocyanin
MRRLLTTALTALVTMMLAACSNSAAPAVPTSSASAGAPGPACVESTDQGAVAVTMENTAYSPNAIAAKVGQVISFTNKDNAYHDVSLDDGSCSTKAVEQDGIVGLLFSVPARTPSTATSTLRR